MQFRQEQPLTIETKNKFPTLHLQYDPLPVLKRQEHSVVITSKLHFTGCERENKQETAQVGAPLNAHKCTRDVVLVALVE